MCDYSLNGLPYRLASDGEQLVLYRFPTNSLGLTCPSDLRANAEQEPASGFGLWSLIKNWFTPTPEPVAVCIPPGARLLLRDIPERLQEHIQVCEEEEVVFTQLTAATNCYRDAVRFSNGSEILLQRLDPGQRVQVLMLALEDATQEQAGQTARE